MQFAQIRGSCFKAGSLRTERKRGVVIYGNK